MRSSSTSYFIVLIFANNVYKAIHDFCGEVYALIGTHINEKKKKIVLKCVGFLFF